MSIIQIIDTFTFYGLDIAVFSAVTCMVVQLLKKTALKRCQRKVITFLPFIVGVILYAVYASVCKLDAAYVLTNYVDVLEHGFSVGSLATLVYVGYEQFIRSSGVPSRAEGVIATLIEGYVPTDEVETVAREIAQAIERDVCGDGAKKTAEILTRSSDGEAGEKDVALLAKLIIETLAHLNTNP